MATKRGRKRQNEMYFGPEEEEAVIEFLESRHIETVNFLANIPLTITHNLGKDVIVSVSYLKPNEKAYGNDNKFVNVDIDITVHKFTENSVTIITSGDVKNAIVIVTNETKRNLLFSEYLDAPLTKMIESIIRKYKLYRKGLTFKEVHNDTLSFLMTKVHKFESGRGKKAYSYFGTICKHYLLGLIIKDDKHMKQTTSYEDISSDVEERKDLTYIIDSDNFSIDDLIKKLLDGIKQELNDENLPSKKKLSDNERKVGLALIEIFEHWETLLSFSNDGSKYNKNVILETMRNFTNLSTKDIRLAMKRYKDLYEVLKYHGL